METRDSDRRACNPEGVLRHPAISDQGLTAIVRLTGGRLQLVRHPADGFVVAFDDADAGTTALDIAQTMEVAAA